MNFNGEWYHSKNLLDSTCQVVYDKRFHFPLPLGNLFNNDLIEFDFDIIYFSFFSGFYTISKIIQLRSKLERDSGGNSENLQRACRKSKRVVAKEKIFTKKNTISKKKTR